MGGFGPLAGGLQGRGRRVSIAVQREFVGGALGGDGKEFVRGHGRGRVRLSVFGLLLRHGNLTFFFSEHDVTNGDDSTG